MKVVLEKIFFITYDTSKQMTQKEETTMREETGLFLFDVMGVVFDVLLPQMGEQLEIIQHMREERKYNNDTFKIINSTKLAGGLSDVMYDRLHEDSCGIGIVEFDLISTAVKTNKWINYAVWCMCDEDAVLLKADKDARELINAVAMMAGFGKIYQNSGIADLNDYAIENKKRETGTKFILSIEDLKKKFENPDFKDAMRYKLAKIQAETNKHLIGNSPAFFGSPARIDNDGLIHPIFFSNSSLREVLGPKQGNISEDLFNRLEAVFAPMIKDTNYKYSYDLTSGLPILTIERDNTYGATENFLIDDGTIMGGSTVSILGTYMTVNGNLDYIFVDAKKLPHIAYSIINRSFYQLSSEEVHEAFSVMLQNYSIYNIIDFSDTPWFDYLTDEEKTTLTKHLSDIIAFIHQDPNLYFSPRLRFVKEKYINPDNFTLVSDSLVKSPLADKRFTSPEICEGLSFICANGMITQYFYNMPNAQSSTTAGGYNLYEI